MPFISHKVKRELYLKVKADIDTYQSRKSDAEQNIQIYNKKLEQLYIELKELKSEICLTCDGHGKIRNWVAQDESRIETCTSCNGLGFKDK